MTPDDIRRMLSNPFYCLRQIHPDFAIEHEPIISEQQFIEAGARLIQEIGPEKYLKELLENLKGN
jgi:hypothetical protein